MPLSKCCNAELKTVSDGEGTSYYECSSCKKPSDPKEETYQPRVGDRVSLEGEVVEIEGERRLVVKLQPDAGEIYVYPKQVANGVLKLLSRKTRKLTKEEAERLLGEKLGESVTIEDNDKPYDGAAHAAFYP